MSGPLVSSLPLPTIDNEDLVTVIDRLNDDQKRFVVQQLLPSILSDVREPRSIMDLDGRLLGYYMPRPAAGDDLLNVSMTDSGTFRIPRPGESTSASGVLRAKKKKAHDLFEVDLGGSD